MELSVQNVFGLLLRSKLMPVPEAQAMYQRWQTEAGDAAMSLPQFLKWIVHRQYLTEYQAALLGRGHADGFVLNQYKILDRLGKGRMAGVYKAVHQLGQVVAIKVLPPSKAKDPQFLGRFQREARLASRLKHPNIVRVFQVGQSGDVHYIVMEYIEGDTLDEVLKRRGPLPPMEAVRLVYLALLGLNHIHERGMVHRDLKPANLMLTPAPDPGPRETSFRSQVKILDIGLARTQGDQSGLELEGGQKGEAQDLTTEGVLLGTPDYMAPEQARDARAADVRSDIYSLGCVLFHAITGRPPFPDSNLISQMIRHATEQPKPLKDFNAAVPDGLQQIVNWMMAKGPNQRYPTPERAAQALQMFLASGAAEALPATIPDQNVKEYLDWIEVENSKDEIELPPLASPVKQATPPHAVKAGSGTHQSAGASPAPPIKLDGQATPGTPGSRKKDTGDRKLRRKEALARRREKKAQKTPLPAAVAAGATPPAIPMAVAAESRLAAAQEFDVELVSAPPPPSKAKEKPNPFQLTPRDFIMFGIGVGGTLLAIIAAMLLAKLLTGKSAPDTSPDTAPVQTAPEVPG